MFMLIQRQSLYHISSHGVPLLLGFRNASKISRREYLYGISPVFAAIMAGRRKIFKIYLHEKFKKEETERDHLHKILEEAQTRKIPVLYKSTNILNRLTANCTHQNIVMEAGKLTYATFDRPLPPSTNDQIWLALDQIHDPMNFGAILRSATYFGVDRVVATNKSCCGLTATVSKASSGAMEWMPVYGVNCMKKFLKKSITSGWDVIGSMGMDSHVKKAVFSCENVTLNKPTILVVGNEGFGLSDEISNVCTQMVTVDCFNPSLPVGLDSLNVAVATGVMLHSLINNQCHATSSNMISS